MKKTLNTCLALMFFCAVAPRVWALEKLSENVVVKDDESFQNYVKLLATKKKTGDAGSAYGLVELEKHKKFRTKNGKIVSFAQLTQILGGDHFITLIKHNPQEYEKTGFIQHVDLFNADGARLLSVSFDGVFYPYWLDNKFYLFTTNRGIEPGPKTRNGFYVYDSTGTLENFVSIDWTNFAFSKSGKHLAILSAFTGEGENIIKPSQLIVFTLNASRQWEKQKEIPLKANISANRITFTDDDRFLLVKAAGGTSFIDYDASELVKHEKSKIKSPQQSTKGEISIIDVKTNFALIYKERK